MTPKMIEEAHFLSPIGCIQVQGSSKGISRVALSEQSPCPAGPIPSSLKNALHQLNEYFIGHRQVFDLTLDLEGHPAFYQQVWKELLKIPFGKTTSYQYIATQLGDANAVRAVGQANGKNPIAIIIPCHRCIAKNGKLQGYFYGLSVKRELLALENPLVFGQQGSLFNNN